MLVVGAGPAGSACAQVLARAGQRVCLVDQQSFPREKVCGDGLIPDAHAALIRLGVAEAVAARAHPVERVACIGPRGGRVEVPGRLAVLPRRELDQIVTDRQAVCRIGADIEHDLAVFHVLHRHPRICVDAHGKISRETAVTAPFADGADQVRFGRALFGHGRGNYLRITFSDAVSESMNAGRLKSRSAYFMIGAACFGNWMS